MGCAIEAIGDGPSPWIGLISNARPDGIIRPFFYEYVDGSPCPEKSNGKYSGACLGSRYWKEDEPLPCKVGSQCVRLLDQNIHNDVLCEDKLSGILCNSASSISGSISMCDIQCEHRFGVSTCDATQSTAQCQCNDRGRPITSCIPIGST